MSPSDGGWARVGVGGQSWSWVNEDAESGDVVLVSSNEVCQPPGTSRGVVQGVVSQVSGCVRVCQDVSGCYL